MTLDEILENLEGSIEQAKGAAICHVDTAQLAALLGAHQQLKRQYEAALHARPGETADVVQAASEQEDGRNVVINLHLTKDHVVTKVGSVMEVKNAESKRIWEALVKHWSYEGQERCQDIDDEMYRAVGLPAKGPPGCTREEWEQGCREYTDRIFGLKEV